MHASKFAGWRRALAREVSAQVVEGMSAQQSSDQRLTEYSLQLGVVLDGGNNSLHRRVRPVHFRDGGPLSDNAFIRQMLTERPHCTFLGAEEAMSNRPVSSRRLPSGVGDQK